MKLINIEIECWKLNCQLDQKDLALNCKKDFCVLKISLIENSIPYRLSDKNK